MKQLSLLGNVEHDPERVGPAAQDDALVALASALPRGLRLGTSSWSFPGWKGLVYDRDAKVTTLSRHGLAAYAQHPLFRTVSVDRSFYAPIPEEELRAYAAGVPDDFRFLVKAPAAVTDVAQRDARGAPLGLSETFLDAAWAVDSFVAPAILALGDKLGPIVFQISPMRAFVALDGENERARIVESLGRFLEGLPRGPLYAVEVRDPELVGRRLAETLARTGARYVVGIHDRMPPASVQVRFAESVARGPFVARWNLLAGHTYESAKASFAPFDRLRVEDEATRDALAAAAFAACEAGDGAFVVANNKAEGSAPLTIRKLAEAIARR